MITTSAPGKLMLFGEHAVVYGRPCLVTAVGLRVYVAAQASDGDISIRTSLESEPYTVSVDDLLHAEEFPRTAAFVAALVKVFYEEFDLRSGLQITTHGPERSFGLGSSSAATVAAAAALNTLFSLHLSQAALAELSHRAVLDVQGVASGFDVMAAVYGGTIAFQPATRLVEPLALTELPLVIGYSGSKVSTVSHVNEVAKLRGRHKRLVDGMFDMMTDITEQARTLMLANEWRAVGELANLSQGLLDGLGVNTLPLTSLIMAARDAGAYGAKLSGAGGGDCMFAVTDETHAEAVRTAITGAGGEVVTLPIGVEGVRVEPDGMPK